MKAAEVLSAAFDNIRDLVRGTVDGLSVDQLAARLDEEANTVGWLVWHLTRVQDDHIAEVAETEQVWTSGGWAERSGLPFPAGATGYGQSADEVAAVRVEAELLVGYHEAVHRATVDFLSPLADEQLDRVVDERWDPPVTLGVRLVSVVTDDMEHIGQAAFIRGLLERR